MRYLRSGRCGLSPRGRKRPVPEQAVGRQSLTLMSGFVAGHQNRAKTKQPTRKAPCSTPSQPAVVISAQELTEGCQSANRETSALWSGRLPNRMDSPTAQQMQLPRATSVSYLRFPSPRHFATNASLMSGETRRFWFLEAAAHRRQLRVGS